MVRVLQLPGTVAENIALTRMTIFALPCFQARTWVPPAQAKKTFFVYGDTQRV